MNIKSRLQKLEAQILPPDSRYCECWMAAVLAIIEAAYEGKDCNHQPPMPDISKPLCEFCGKAFNPRDIQLSKNIEKISNRESENSLDD